jgi:predicted nucleotidyltransferase
MPNLTNPTPAEALAIVTSRYEGAAFAFAAGSIMRGEGTRLSDIDLVVIYDHLEAARRESFIVVGIPVERSFTTRKRWRGSSTRMCRVGVPAS